MASPSPKIRLAIIDSWDRLGQLAMAPPQRPQFRHN